MQVTRQDLIQICDKFLQGEISKQELQDYASALITTDHEDWDHVIDDTLFEWDSEEMNFPINIINMKLWKDRLISGVDKLPEYNNWNSHIDKQKEICEKYNSKWAPINKSLRVAVSADLISDPINGLRHPGDNRATGWFIWTGDYSKAEDFFKPMCAEHLLQIRPQIIKYLGLDSGFRFLADKNGYEDVWYDEILKEVD